MGVKWNLKASPGYLINRASRLFTRIGESRLRTLDFGVGQLPVLMSLKDGAALPQKELAVIAGVEQPSMAQLLARMERDGLIERRPDPSDKRSSLIVLTKLAVSRTPAAREMLAQGSAQALAGFTEHESLTLCYLLQRVIDNLEKVAREVAD